MCVYIILFSIVPPTVISNDTLLHTTLNFECIIIHIVLITRMIFYKFIPYVILGGAYQKFRYFLFTFFMNSSVMA